MALSKPERITKVEGDVKVTILIPKIMEFCKVSYSKAVSIEIIDHLLGGLNMDYKAMELSNSHQCFAVCRHDLLQNVKSDQKILFFEDRKSTTADVIIAIVKQPRTNKRREHIILYAVIRLAIQLEPTVGFMRYFDLTVRKPRMATTLEQQVQMVTNNVFSKIYRSADYIKTYLLEGGYVHNLDYPDHKWKFISGGPRKPKFFVETTPDASPDTTQLDSSLETWTEDVSDSEPSDGDTTLSYAEKLTSRPVPPVQLKRTQRLRFHSFPALSQKKSECTCDEMSPLLQSSEEVYVISSDDNLEASMLALEEKVTSTSD